MLKFLDPILWFLLLKRVYNKRIVKRDNQRFYREVDLISGQYKTPVGEALFYPELPKKKSALSATFQSLGYHIHKDPEQPADFMISWEDATFKEDVSKQFPAMKNSWNVGCTDIGKTVTDEVFQEVFSYSTRVDPTTHQGKMLEKSEINALHEARVIKGPISKPKEGYIYQLVLNNQVKGYLYEDVRVTYINGEIPFCYLNYRLKGKRFSNKKFSAKLVEKSTVITKDEELLIRSFCQQMKVDYAEMDCIRNRDDRKLYIIDVNTTAFGPANGLRYEDKMEGLRLYQEALQRQLKKKAAN